MTGQLEAQTQALGKPGVDWVDADNPCTRCGSISPHTHSDQERTKPRRTIRSTELLVAFSYAEVQTLIVVLEDAIESNVEDDGSSPEYFLLKHLVGKFSAANQ